MAIETQEGVLDRVGISYRKPESTPRTQVTEHSPSETVQKETTPRDSSDRDSRDRHARTFVAAFVAAWLAAAVGFVYLVVTDGDSASGGTVGVFGGGIASSTPDVVISRPARSFEDAQQLWSEKLPDIIRDPRGRDPDFPLTSKGVNYLERVHGPNWLDLSIDRWWANRFEKK